jgi:hypothetical protein
LEPTGCPLSIYSRTTNIKIVFWRSVNSLIASQTYF